MLRCELCGRFMRYDAPPEDVASVLVEMGYMEAPEPAPCHRACLDRENQNAEMMAENLQVMDAEDNEIRAPDADLRKRGQKMAESEQDADAREMAFCQKCSRYRPCNKDGLCDSCAEAQAHDEHYEVDDD